MRSSNTVKAMAASAFVLSNLTAVPTVVAAAVAKATAAVRAGDACNNDLARNLVEGAPSTTLLVKAFRKGDRIALARKAADDTSESAIAKQDMCLIKVIVGPGLAGPANEWSTSRGVGLEIWLPASEAWSGRSLSVFPGGWTGDCKVASADSLADLPRRHSLPEPVRYANELGFVTATNDGGIQPPAGNDFGRGMAMMLPDGSINEAGWKNLSSRAAHVMAVAVKAAAQRYYGKAPHHNYLAGCSSGGRAAYASAQNYPGDYDGILAGAPSITQSHLFPGLAYGHIVMQRDLGGKLLSREQLDVASRAAVKACDTTVTGQHDGYVTDYEKCTYDPTMDKSVLCAESGGTAPVGTCLTKLEATAINKMWYGATRDGSVPPPAADNGTSPIRSADHLWWGVQRGTNLYTVAGSEGGVPRPYDLPMDQVALSMESPWLAMPSFKVGTMAGADGWKNMSYADLAAVMDQGRAMQPWFANIDSDNADIRAFAAKGGKLLTYFGSADPNVPPASAINYFMRVNAIAGGTANTLKFHRLFLVPGMGHCRALGTVDNAVAPLVPLDEMVNALIAWVEKDQAPTQLLARTTAGQPVKSRPVCMYPNKIQFNGGDPNNAANFSCRRI